MAVNITYNSYSFPNVYSPYSYTQTPSEATLSFHTLITADSAQNMLIAEAAMLAAVKQIKKDFTVDFHDVSEFSLGNLKGGFVASVTAHKMQTPELCTETSRPYRITISFLLPYTQDNYKISGTWTMSKSESKQTTFSFHAIYSASEATPPVSATSMAHADFFSWCESIISLFKDPAEIYERLHDNLHTDIHDRRATASATYRQILYEYSTIPAKIYDGVTQYSLSIAPTTACGLIKFRESPPLVTLSLSFRGFISKLESHTQPIKDYKQYIKEQLVREGLAILDISGLGFTTPYQTFVTSSNIYFNPSNYSFSGSMTLLGLLKNTIDNRIISYRETAQVTFDESWVRTKLWDGKDYTYHSYSSGKQAFLNRHIFISSLSELTFLDIPDILPKWFVLPLVNGRWVLNNYGEHQSQEALGFTRDTSDTTPRTFIFQSSWFINYTFMNEEGEVQTIVGVT